MINDKVINNIGFNFNNSFLELPEIFYIKTPIAPSLKPTLVILNQALAEDLGLNYKELNTSMGIKVLSGNLILKDGAYIAQAYAGHQYGYFTMLGDGRALLLGEQITPKGKRYDIQLKGSGRTPFSRRGDGKAVLGPMLREYIISEAMYALGIPTTRSLAVLKSGEVIYREKEEEGALLCRVASSHIRFGTFQFAYNFGNTKDVKVLADYCIQRHFYEIKDSEDKYLKLLKKIIKDYGKLIAKWQSIGFIHGVMNTDNMLISGETIDYGPCAFMDIYSPHTVFSSIDTEGRYAYKNQPAIAQWNLCRFAESILPLLHDNREAAIEIAEEAISDFKEIYYLNWISLMRSKVGIFNEEDDDKRLIDELLSIMEKYKADYTNTFIALTFKDFKGMDIFNSDEFKAWYCQWQKRLTRQIESKDLAEALMKRSNPAIIPRNHIVEEALASADKGNYSLLNKLLTTVSKPFDHENKEYEFLKVPNPHKGQYKTYCGT